LFNNWIDGGSSSQSLQIRRSRSGAAAERPTGTCLAIVTGDVLQRSQQTIHFRYVWDGRRVSQLYAFDNEGKRIEAAKLASHEDVLAAA
jgi:hypothetical protein